MIRLCVAVLAAVMACGPALAQGRLPTPEVNVTAMGSATARTASARAADVVNVLDFGPANMGTGGDDIVGIQAAVNRAAAIGAHEVFFPQPPSGAYNVCAAGIELPGLTVSLRLQGATVGGTAIRILPGCASPPAQVLHQPRTTSQADNVRVTLSHLTIDGYCLATYDIYSEFAAGLTADHMNFRNVATGGANIRLASGGYEYDIGNTNTAENVNDTGHTCYANAAALPNYNLWTSGTDSRFDGLVAVGAKIANIFQDSGGNNRFLGTHTWNYYNGTPGSSGDLRSQYGFYLEGPAVVIGSCAESYTGSGIYLANSSGTGRQRVIGNTFNFVGNPANTIIGVDIASGTTYSYVAGNDAWQLKFIGFPQNIVMQDGTADPTTTVVNNVSATYQTTQTIRSPGAATQETWLTLKNPSTASFASIGMAWQAGSAAGAITFGDYGTSQGGYFAFQPPTSSGAAPILGIVDGPDGWFSIGGNTGAEALRAILTASAVNRIEVVGATTGNDPILRCAGSDTNVPCIVTSQGTGAIFFEIGAAVEQTLSSAGTVMTHGLAVGTPTGGLAGTGIVNVATGYRVNNAAGVSCAANTVSLTTLVVTAGIVTHC